ncbi:MAG: acyl-CoA dehydrogenase family protein [Hyphomonadaceae bacterium]
MSNEELRQDVRAWLAENWTDDAQRPGFNRAAWLRKVHDARWLAPRWPAEHGGRALADEQARIVESEFKAAGAPGGNADRVNIPANTLLEFGQEPLKQRLLAGMLTGEIQFCLLYSEPNAGSDLASVRTRADRDGDSYIVNGQKVWTSGARTADYGLLIARTNWDAPKHKGLSFFFCPMKQPGIDIRPLHQITGESHFNEVFIDNAVVPADHLIGKEGEGWRVLQTALAYERVLMGEGAAERRKGVEGESRADLIALARAYGKLSDPVIRQEIANAIAYRRLNELNALRAKTEMAADKSSASPIMSLSKLAMSRVLHNNARVMTLIIGAEAMLDGAEHPAAAETNYRALYAYINSIGGGTDQIQRNIIGERVLGLPREAEPDRDIPFRDSLAVKGAQPK